MEKNPCIYILSNKSNTVLYIGVTSDLKKRVWQHQRKIVEGFTKKYNISKLVYFESLSTMTEAIMREKQLKKWSRIKKEKLINTMNPNRLDLSISHLDWNGENSLQIPPLRSEWHTTRHLVRVTCHLERSREIYCDRLNPHNYCVQLSHG